MLGKLSLLAAILVALPSFGSAQIDQGRRMTFSGKIVVASLDSAVISGDFGIGFITDSPEAKVIFASCGDGALCRVTGIVRGAGVNTFFSHVTKAVLVKRPAGGA